MSQALEAFLGTPRGAGPFAELKNLSTAVRPALIAVLTNLVADQGAGGRATNGACRPAKDGIAGNTADHGPDTGPDLGVGGVRSTTTQGKGCSTGGRKQDVTDFHG